MPDSSAVKSHAGTVTENTTFSGEYSPNGTDVNYGAMAKSVLELVNSGKMTPAEGLEFLKAMPPWLAGKGDKSDKGGKKDKDKDGEDDGDKDDEGDDKDKKVVAAKKVEKSLEEIAAENPDVSEGMDVSAFLKGFVESFSKSLSESETRITERVLSAIKQNATKQESFSKSLIGTLETIGEGLSATNSRVAQVEAAPAAAPKSATTGILAKSFGGESVNLSRQQILDAMVEMVTLKKSLNDRIVTKFESTGEVSDQVMKQVIAHVQGK
jgi:hypothetical protein